MWSHPYTPLPESGKNCGNYGFQIEGRSVTIINNQFLTLKLYYEYQGKLQTNRKN